MGSPAIEVDRVSKAYRLYPTPRHRALELLTFGTRTYHTHFWALSDVSLRVAAGATLGLVGNNGSGKSTLLQLIAGIMSPTSGRVAVNGRVSSLLELGAGFNPEFTGRENVELYGIVMGMSREETPARLPGIEALRRHRRLHRSAGQVVLERHVRAAGVLGGDSRQPGRPAR